MAHRFSPRGAGGASSSRDQRSSSQIPRNMAGQYTSNVSPSGSYGIATSAYMASPFPVIANPPSRFIPSNVPYTPAYGQQASLASPPSANIWSKNPIFTPNPSDYNPDGEPEDHYGKPKSHSYTWEDSPLMQPSGSSHEYAMRSSLDENKGKSRATHQRKPSNRDEFDGPHQLLERPTLSSPNSELPHLATHLYAEEQDRILGQVNDCLSQCAFDFIARYQFPIPLEADKRPVSTPADREWTEWVYLLKRLATKRRIPARVLYNGQIKQFITILENSLEMRHAAKHQSRPLKDDRNVLQLISAGLQVAKIVKDANAMAYLDHLYVETEDLIRARINRIAFLG